jgi:Rps23 Pro-64 3,4-dihydroxylase Tpa1-like proline 4-hydroxylase
MEKELKVINKFFNSDEIKFIKNYSEDVFESRNIWKSSKVEWDKRLNTSENDILIYYLNEVIDSEVYEMVQKKTKTVFDMEPYAMNFFFYLSQSNINWHDDHKKRAGATIYLNRKWHRDYGGYFIYEKDKKLGIEYPSFNKCIFQSGGVDHATTLTSKDAPVRKILQIFF